MRVPRHQVEGPAGDQHPRESPTGGGEGAHRRRAGGSPATPPEAAGLSHQETWHLRQQSHQGVELIACHALIACLHLTRVQEPVRTEANSAGSCFHRPVPPPPQCSAGSMLISTAAAPTATRGHLALTPQSHPEHQPWSAHSPRGRGFSPSACTRPRVPHSPQRHRFSPSSPDLKPGLSQTQE